MELVGGRGVEVGGKKKFPNYSEMENFWRPLDGQCCQENIPPGIFLHIMFTPGTIMTMKQLEISGRLTLIMTSKLFMTDKLFL